MTLFQRILTKTRGVENSELPKHHDNEKTEECENVNSKGVKAENSPSENHGLTTV